MARFPYLRAGGSAAFHRHHWAGLGRELRPGLIAAVSTEATVPVVIDGAGNCHVYVDASADLDMAETGRAPVEFADPLNPFGDSSGGKASLKAAESLQHGQTAATILDLNGDAVQDMLAVDSNRDVWAVFGTREVGQALGATISLTRKVSGPVTVTVRAKGRCLGMHVLRPGVPVFVGREQPGPTSRRPVMNMVTKGC